MTQLAPHAGRLALGIVGAGAALGAALALVRDADAHRIATDGAWRALNEPLDGRQREVVAGDGTALHVEVFGPDDAPAIVLVHGWMCALRLWQPQIAALSNEFRVIAYDQRGHGRSAPAADGDYSIDAFADDLRSVLDACLADGETATLGGHSMGAMTIAAWAHHHRDEVARRVHAAALLSTGMGDLISESLVIRAPARLDGARQRIGHALLCSQAPLAGPRPIIHRGVRYIALGESASPGQVAFCEQMFIECRPEVRGGCGGTLSRLALHDAIQSLDLPTVVVTGEDDRLTPPAHSRRLAAELPNLVELVEVPGAGHMTTVEAPAEVTSALRTLASNNG